MDSENPSDDIFVDVDAEGQSDLLGNSFTAPGRIASFHLNDGIDEFFGRSFRTRPAPVIGRKQEAILVVCQHLVKVEQS